MYPGLIDLLRRTGNGSLALEYVNEYKNARILTLRDSRTKAGVLANEGEYRSAMEELEDIVSKSGENLDILSLAQFQAVRMMYEPALTNFNRILETEPDNSIAILGKSMVLGSMGRQEEAMMAIDTIRSGDPVEKMRYRALVNRVSGNTAAELDSVERMLEIAPDNVLNILIAAETYQRQGMGEERRQALKRAVELQPDNLEVLVTLAEELVARSPDDGNLDVILDRIARTKPNTARVLRLVRDATEKSTGQLKPTSDQVEKAAELAETLTNLFEAQRVAWLMHVAVDDHENAYRIALRAFRNHPTRIQPAFWARRSALQAGMYQEAVDIMEAGMERVSERERLAYTLEFSNMCMQLGFVSRAYSLLRGVQEFVDDEERMEELIDRSAGNGISARLIRVTLLRAMLGSSRAREAAELFGPLISGDKKLLDSWMNATRRLDVEDARNALEIIRPFLESPEQIIIHVEQLSALANRSMSSEDVGPLRKSLSDLEGLIPEEESAIERRSRTSIVRASLMGLEGDFEGAIDELRGVRDLIRKERGTSDSIDRIAHVALNNMALYQCELTPPDTDSALKNIVDALNNAPDALLPSLHETRSRVLMTRGQCEDAIDALEEAIGLSKDIEQMTEFRVTLAETLYECDLIERCIAESKMLQEYIYGTPRPDITKLDRLNVLIKKGQNDEE